MDEISLTDLFNAWDKFKIDKRKKRDVQIFERNLEDNLFNLYNRLKIGNYRHSSYTLFNIYDPKFRHIHKAMVEDRIVHHAVTSIIDPLFDRTFLFDSYSCRKNKGTHKAVQRLFVFIRKVSRNYKSPCCCLKLDIKKFFERVDHAILLDLIREKVKSDGLLRLIQNIIGSFSEGKGIPIGNLTSQIFSNVYLNKLDQFVKHELKIKYYIRYCDDFVIVSEGRLYLEKLIDQIDSFLRAELKLSLHEDKKIIRKYTQGIDFLGYILLPYVILPRTKTRRRLFKKMRMKTEEFRKGLITKESLNQSFQSYLGFLTHANTYELTQKLKNQLWFWLGEGGF